MLIVAGIWYARSLQWTRDGISTTGIVVELQKTKGGFRPTVEYIDSSGIAHLHTSMSTQNPPIAQIGESVTIRYDKNNPERALIDSFVSLWLGPMMFAIAGGIQLLLGLVFWKRAQHHRAL